MTAFRRVERNNVIAFFKAGNTGANVNHNARTLVPQNSGKNAFRVSARERVVVGMANAGSFNLNQNLTKFWTFQIDSFNGQGFA